MAHPEPQEKPSKTPNPKAAKPSRSSMEALLKNPENQKLLKKKK
jgi:hypothetical protein